MNLSSLPSRPFQIIVFGVFILLAIVGLALFASYSGSNGGGAKIGTVTIWGILPTDAVQGQLDALKTTNKEYGAVNYVQKPADSFDATLANAIASGAGPDMVLISQEQLLAEQSKLVVIPFSAIPQRTYLDTFVPIDELYLTDKGTYGVPFAVDPLVLYYNRSLLSSAGVAAPPATWEAVTGLAPRLTQKTNGQLIKSGIALGDYANIPSARAIVSLLLFQSGSPIASLSSNGTIQAALTGNPSGDSFGVTPAESAIL
jgi:multiple sugar transport system substrate-binding protein